MDNFFTQNRDFSSLSVKDLLDARDAYHVHLAHLEHVIATAIGRYCIRKDDPDVRQPRAWKPRGKNDARTLENTVIEPWSWPCVLVFVKEWCHDDYFRGRPDQAVPRLLYLADGRVVPTCIVLATKQEEAPPPLKSINFPSDLLGGGYPILTDVQGEERIGSLGCLVTDGHTVFALTNRHVAGPANQEVFTLVRSQRQTSGVSDEKSSGKLAFNDAYPGWQQTRTYVNIDAGLIKAKDLQRWTAQVYGIGELDLPIDLNVNTLSLDLIGCPVKAFGGVSGELRGTIQALFYRYKSVGGFDYIADFLIGPRNGETLATLPGDSGTLWVFDHEKEMDAARNLGLTGARARRFRPIALQWGGHILSEGDGKTRFQFALATNLSTICRTLDLDVVRSWNIGHDEYWGRLGHYKIAAAACALVSTLSLQTFLNNNLSLIAFDDDSIRQGALKKIDSDQFVPLADVPDFVWRKIRKRDDANHFADMDEKGKGKFKNMTLLDLCKDPLNVDMHVWNEFYDSLGVNFKRGALPFRVWQMYDAMVDFLKAKKIPEFLCTAGILAHYVGDACQPLHVSHLHHGSNESEADVHSAYEESMLNRFRAELLKGTNDGLKGKQVRNSQLVTGGKQAALLVIELMRKTIDTLPPVDIIEAFNDESDDRNLHMWEVLDERTISCIVRGCLTLATLWESAWLQASDATKKFTASDLEPVSKQTLMDLYKDNEFVPSFFLRDMEKNQVLGKARAAGRR